MDAGMRMKKCPRCAEAFVCGAGACWCVKKWVPAAVLEALRQQYEDCLCAGCLDEITAEAGRRVPSAAGGETSIS